MSQTNTETDNDPFHNVIPLFGRENAIKVKIRRRAGRRAQQREAVRAAVPPQPEIGDRMMFMTAGGKSVPGTLVDIDDSQSPPMLVVRCDDGITRTGAHITPPAHPTPTTPGDAA